MNKVYLLLAFAGLFGIGSALKCYTCISLSTDFCGVDFAKNTTYEKTCPAELDRCGKIVLLDKANNVTTYTRSCTKKVDKCDQEDNTKKLECHFCKGDLCNTAAIPASVSSYVYILPAALFLLTATSRV